MSRSHQTKSQAWAWAVHGRRVEVQPALSDDLMERVLDPLNLERA